jgi:CRISPR-associated protein Cas5d
MNSPLLEVKVWGAFGCFTRPEFGTERVSYEVMTPSAARGVLEAIFWKPEFSWRVRQIAVLPPLKRDLAGKPLASERVAPFRHTSILRNEVNLVQSDRSARDWMKSGKGGYFADEDRAQRHTLALRDVAYVIRADVALKPHAVADGLHPAKYRDQFRRRVARGQCHHQPYLGTREFSAFFGPSDEEEPVNVNDDLGLMLFDLEFNDDPSGKLLYLTHDAEGARATPGKAKPKFFPANLEAGVLNIPPELYEARA